MKSTTLILLLILAVLSLTNCTKDDKAKPKLNENSYSSGSKMTPAQQVEYGKYLVSVNGCHDCHSPKVGDHVPDPTRLLSGFPSSEKLAPIADRNVLKDYVLFNMDLTASTGPWGTSFAANLTPDETGLGSWTFKQFEKALREGKFKGMDNSRMLLPPMPWQNFANFSNKDLEAIWAYLQSLPPVKNVVPAPIPPAI